MKTLITILILSPTWLFAQSTSKMPEWGFERFNEQISTEIFQIGEFVDPRFLEADFTGDGAKDLAIPVERKDNGKRGVLILFKSENMYFLAGGGNTFGPRGNDFKWLDIWSVNSDKTTYGTTFYSNGDIKGTEEVRLNHPAISVREEEGSGGLIYYDGEKFVWIHQGD